MYYCAAYFVIFHIPPRAYKQPIPLPFRDLRIAAAWRTQLGYCITSLIRARIAVACQRLHGSGNTDRLKPKPDAEQAFESRPGSQED